MRKNQDARSDVQKIGEDAAADLLAEEGWTVLHRNWSLRLGELDIVARRGGCLVFVEVKARRAPAYVDPALGVDWRKQRQLRRVAEARSEEHTSELQSRLHLVCRLLLEKKK